MSNPRPGSSAGAPQPSIFRTATSRYTTAEQSTLDDLKCQICLGVVRVHPFCVSVCLPLALLSCVQCQALPLLLSLPA